MIPFFRKTQNPWDHLNLLDMIPKRKITAITDPDTLKTTLLVPKFSNRFFKKWLQPQISPQRAFFRLHLDEKGSCIWQLLDDQTPLGTIYEIFLQKFSHEDKLLDRFVWFIRDLYSNRWIELNIPTTHHEPLTDQ